MVLEPLWKKSDNIGENLDDLDYAYDFTDATPKAQSIIDRLDFIKIKTSARQKTVSGE